MTAGDTVSTAVDTHAPARGRILEAAADRPIEAVLLRPGRFGRFSLDPDVLERDAHLLKGAPVWAGPEDPTAKSLRGSLPRPVSDLAGAVEQAWFDPDYSEPGDDERGFQSGAVVGRLALTEAWANRARRLPGAIRVEANLGVASTRPRGDGRRGLMVEALSGDPELSSIELTTKSQTGGRVMALREAAVPLEEPPAVYRPQVWATPPPTPAQLYRETLLDGTYSRQADRVDLRSDGERDRVGAFDRLVADRHPVGPEVAMRIAEAEDASPEPVPAVFGGEGSAWADALRRKGLDPRQFGGAA